MDPAPLLDAFRQQFHDAPAFLVRAPGRVNLIGEHTDYNEGFVLPMAIEQAVWIALRPRADREVRLRSLDYPQAAEISLDRLEKGPGGWVEYLKGMAWALEADGRKLGGWEGLIRGDVPRGSGLSSSAAVELACGRAFAAASGLDWDPAAMARLAQKAENQWVGVNCGIMDQMVSAAARRGHALFLDCRSLEYQHIPLPAGRVVVILDTSTRRGLVDSAYNERRAQCEAAARFFGVPALRDVDLTAYQSRAAGLDEVTRRRARHVVSENGRVLQAVAALRRGDADAFGACLDASHASLRDDFEVSNQALDTIVAIARRQPGCYGARMTGAGFGGCAVALLRLESAAEFSAAVASQYRHQTGLTASIYISQPGDGAGLVNAA